MQTPDTLAALMEQITREPAEPGDALARIMEEITMQQQQAPRMTSPDPDPITAPAPEYRITREDLRTGERVEFTRTFTLRETAEDRALWISAADKSAGAYTRFMVSTGDRILAVVQAGMFTLRVEDAGATSRPI